MYSAWPYTLMHYIVGVFEVGVSVRGRALNPRLDYVRLESRCHRDGRLCLFSLFLIFHLEGFTSSDGIWSHYNTITQYLQVSRHNIIYTFIEFS